MANDSALPATAPAVRLHKYGGRDVLIVEDVTVAAPADGEILVRVLAAGLNPGEASIREGKLHERLPATFPSGEGTDFAGIVVALGAGVDSFTVGAEVIGWSEKRSSQASFVVVPATQAVLKPASVEWPVAGSFFVAAVTAFAAVRAIAVQPGDTVVVSSAGGGVGLIVVQLLSLAGATVIGIASEPDFEWLRAHGVTPIAYGDGVADRIRAAAPHGVDALIDTHGPEYVDLGIELGVPPQRIETIIAFEAAERVGAKAEGSVTASTTEILQEMVDHLDAGELEIRIAETFPLTAVRDAYELLEQGHPRGKVVLIP
jgi:NADPH2:quinone reductase